MATLARQTPITCNECGETLFVTDATEWQDHRDEHAESDRQAARQAARNMRQARDETLDSQAFMRPGR